jgi:hypothetical protein
MRLFDHGEPIPLALLSARTFKTGVLNLGYAPTGAADPVASPTLEL